MLGHLTFFVQKSSHKEHEGTKITKGEKGGV